MHINTHRRQRGLSLVEVFVALLVLSVGLIALAKLQVDLVRGGADARARTIALSLAEEKVEDLRAFALTDGSGAWNTSNAVNPAFVMAWSYIDTNTGGRLVPQATYSSALEVAGVRFTRTWEVDDRDFTNVASGITSRTKDVRVTVSWQNEAGATQTVNTVANLVEIPPGNVALASEPVAERPPGPKINYTPGVAPEIISVPIDTGTGKRETTKPLPTVVGSSGSNLVRFDVVNYHQDGSRFVVDKREEFVTVNCTCAFAADGPARTPARTVFQNGTIRDVPGKVVLPGKTRGVDTQTGVNAQPLCQICCRDHHDVSDDEGDHFFNPSDTQPHDHYRMSVSATTPVSSTSIGAEYDEACRLKRVNGVFQVFEDWKLDTLTVLPGDFLTNLETQDDYVNYVKDYVEYRVLGGSEPAKPTGRDTSVPSGANKQLFARALYVEVPDGLADYINEQLLLDPSKQFEDFLDQIPFYDLNLTKLANWSSRNRPVVRVTSTAVRTEAINQDAYSRGRAEGVPYDTRTTPVSGSTVPVDVRLIASLRMSNTGVTSTPPISPNEDEGHLRDTPPLVSPTTGPPENRQLYYATTVDPEPTLPLEHRDDSVLVTYLPPGSPGISGDIFPSSNVTAGSPQLLITSVRFEGTSNGACTLNVVGASVDYTCIVPSDWSGSIVFSPSTLTYCGIADCSLSLQPYSNVTASLLGQTVWVEE
jgi:type IV pilus modification protein PilV